MKLWHPIKDRGNFLVPIAFIDNIAIIQHYTKDTWFYDQILLGQYNVFFNDKQNIELIKRVFTCKHSPISDLPWAVENLKKIKNI